MGWPSNNFWNRIRNATAVGEISATQGSVKIVDRAIYLKIFGGQVVPKTRNAQTIPAIPEAYAAGSPREGAHPELEFSFGWDPKLGKWRPALMTKNWQGGTKTVTRTKKNGEVVTKEVRDRKQPGGIWYWLCKATWHQPDPDALPPVEQLQGSILDAVRSSMMNAALRGVR